MVPHATEAHFPANIQQTQCTQAQGVAETVTGMATRLKRYPETGITVLVVGAGIGGLTTAIESWRKGHSVRILERSVTPIYTGKRNRIVAVSD